MVKRASFKIVIRMGPHVLSTRREQIHRWMVFCAQFFAIRKNGHLGTIYFFFTIPCHSLYVHANYCNENEHRNKKLQFDGFRKFSF